MLDREQTIIAAAKTHGRKYYFMICDTCLWCASVFEPNLSKYRETFLCPVCQGSKIEAIPLASDKWGEKEVIDRKTASQFGLDQD
jgi:hypothetical protein